MPGKDELDSLKDAESSLQYLKAEAESDEMRHNTSEHKRLLHLLKAYMVDRINEEQFWVAVGQD